MITKSSKCEEHTNIAVTIQPNEAPDLQSERDGKNVAQEDFLLQTNDTEIKAQKKFNIEFNQEEKVRQRK